MKIFITVLFLVMIIRVQSVTKEDLIARITEKLSIMDNRMSFLIQHAAGSVYLQEHLATNGTQPYDDNTIIHIASGCKWIAMATIMKLVEYQLLDLDDRVSKYYPDFAKSNPGLTIKHLMTHTSGYKLADDWVFDLDISLQDSVKGIVNGGKYSASTVYFQGGTKVGYSDIGMQIAGGIAEIVGQKSFQELFQEYIATPMEMVNATFTAFDGEKGTNVAIADGLLIRMVDYANFLRMLLNQGAHERKTILYSSTVELMLKDYTGDLPVDSTIMTEVVGQTVESHYSFAIGSWVDEKSNDKPNVFSSPGVHGFQNYIDLENKYLCIFYLRTETKNEPQVSELFSSMKPDIKAFYESSRGNASVIGIMAMIIAFFII